MANDKRERALAAIAERYVDEAKYSIHMAIDDAYDAGQARAEQLERELAQFQKTSFAMREALEDRVTALERELAAERERSRKADEAAAAELQRCREAVRRALVYLTDKDDVESTPHHAIGHAVHELKALSAAPPVEVQRCPSDIPCNPLGGRVLVGCPLHDPPTEAPCEFGPECPACKEERGDYWREECADITRKLEQLRAKLATIRACVLEATA